MTEFRSHHQEGSSQGDLRALTRARRLFRNDLRQLFSLNKSRIKFDYDGVNFSVGEIG